MKLNLFQLLEHFRQKLDAPMIHIPGFTFPVKEMLLEDVLETTRCHKFPIQFEEAMKATVDMVS